MKKYLLLIVAVASLLAGSCLKSIDDEFATSTTLSGQVVNNEGPVYNCRVVVGVYSDDELFSTYTDVQGFFSLTVDYNSMANSSSYIKYSSCYLEIKGHKEPLQGFGKSTFDYGIINI